MSSPRVTEKQDHKQEQDQQVLSELFSQTVIRPFDKHCEPSKHITMRKKPVAKVPSAFCDTWQLSQVVRLLRLRPLLMERKYSHQHRQSHSWRIG